MKETRETAGGLKLPPKTALYLLVGIGVVVLFVLLGIVPMYQSLGRLDDSITQARFRIEEQNVLHPIYLRMLAIAAAGGAKAPQLPKKQNLNQDQVSQLTDTLAQVIVKSGLEARSVVPDPSSLSLGSKSLAVTVNVRGGPERFHAFLQDLALQPSFENMESLVLTPSAGSLEYTVKFWMAAE